MDPPSQNPRKIHLLIAIFWAGVYHLNDIGVVLRESLQIPIVNPSSTVARTNRLILPEYKTGRAI
jgi:hypothetical protein